MLKKLEIWYLQRQAGVPENLTLEFVPSFRIVYFVSTGAVRSDWRVLIVVMNSTGRPLLPSLQNINTLQIMEKC